MRRGRLGDTLEGMKRLAVLVAALVVLAAGCGSSGSGGANRTPVVVDTDLSSDDAIALLYLAQSPQVDLRAVTVSGTGLVHCPAGLGNAARLLALAGRPDTPVACGRELPLAGSHAVPEEWRSAADGLFGLTLPPARAHDSGSAISLLRREAPGATVLELAPMTNLAQALRTEPSLAQRVSKVVAMAGAVDVPGNSPGDPAAETNAWVDPSAMRTVLRSGVPLTLVPLDATNQVPVTPYVGEALRRYHHRTPAATAVWELVDETRMADGGSYFWDPLAAELLVDRSVAAMQTRRIDVEPNGRTTVSAGGARVTLATRIARERFEQSLLRGLLGSARFTIPPRRPTGTISWEGRTCRYSGASSWTQGRVVVDTVNRSHAPFQFFILQIDPPHTLAELKAWVARITGPPRSGPSWLTIEYTGRVPPRADLTWAFEATSGTTGFVVPACVAAVPPYAALGAAVPVFGR
jgi:pyrimidine-specific ribonucleoside hydrolase